MSSYKNKVGINFAIDNDLNKNLKILTISRPCTMAAPSTT